MGAVDGSGVVGRAGSVRPRGPQSCFQSHEAAGLRPFSMALTGSIWEASNMTARFRQRELESSESEKGGASRGTIRSSDLHNVADGAAHDLEINIFVLNT